MITELRATQADINARRHFTADKAPITDARAVIEDWLTPAAAPDPVLRASRSAASFSLAEGIIEVG